MSNYGNYGEVTHQNTFSRVVYNQASMGGGSDNECFTNPKIMKSLRGLLRAPVDEDGNELPSTWFDITCGDLRSLGCLADVSNHPQRTLFGCEARADIARKAVGYFPQFKKNILNCDSAAELKMQNASISVGGLNPPYGSVELNTGKTVRQERRFLEKITPYIMKGGILVWIIPHRVFSELGYLGYLKSAYEILGVWKTVGLTDWFSHMSPVAIIARRQVSCRLSNDELAEVQKRYIKYDDLPDLPAEGSVPMEERFEYPSFDEKNIQLFQTSRFDEHEVFTAFAEQDSERPDLLSTRVFKTCLVPEHRNEELCPSPIPLKGSHKVLALIGSNTDVVEVGEDGVDKFLLRISVKQKETAELAVSESSGAEGKPVLVSKSSASMHMAILEPNGNWIEPEMNGPGAQEEEEI